MKRNPKLMISGIYKITCKENNKCYIGKSADIIKRWHQHVYYLTNKVGNRMSYDFISDFHEYGIESFIFEILETCEVTTGSSVREEFYIRKFESNKLGKGYNVLQRSGLGLNKNIKSVDK